MRSEQVIATLTYLAQRSEVCGKIRASCKTSAKCRGGRAGLEREITIIRGQIPEACTRWSIICCPGQSKVCASVEGTQVLKMDNPSVAMQGEGSGLKQSNF